MEWIVGLISAVTAFIGAIWGIVKYYDAKGVKEQEKREKAEAERQRAIEERETRRDEIFNNIVGSLSALSEDSQDQKEEIAFLHARFDLMHDQIEQMSHTIEENEMDRLRSDIIDCVSKLRNGFEMSQVDLEHIHHCYDKYRAKGGNSYIESCMEYVFEYERECREAGVIGFENGSEK